MALTKVGPAGIGSTPGTGYVIGDSFLHSTGLNATNAYYTGIVTAQTFRVLGNFQVDGTTTTLDTEVTSVDKLEVAANNTTVGVAITQSGSGDILNLYDGSSEVFSVADGGTVTASGDISISDKIVHTGDTNTAIRFPANDTVTVETGGSERFRVKSNGNVGIGTDNPTAKLQVQGTIYATTNVDVPSGDIYCGGNASSGSESGIRMRSAGFISASRNSGFIWKGYTTGTSDATSIIGSDGSAQFTELLVGTNNATSIYYGNAPVQVYGTGDRMMSLLYTQANASGPMLNFTKSRSTNDGAGTIVNSGDLLGAINFIGDDGNDFRQAGGEIRCKVDGTPGSNDMPGRLEFLTTSDGAQFPTERLRIDSSGRLLVGTDSTIFDNNFGIGKLQATHKDGYQHVLFSGHSAAAANATCLSVGRSRGTQASPGYLSSGDHIARFSATSYNGGNYQSSGCIDFYAADQHASNDLPGYIALKTVPDGSATLTERLRIDSNGAVTVSTTGYSDQYSYSMKLGQGAYTPSGTTSPHYGLWVRQLGPRYALNYGVYSEIEDDSGFYGGATLDGLASVRGIGVYGSSPTSASAYQKAIGVYGKATNADYNYNTTIGVRGRVETGTSSFIANNGQKSYGGHFVATGKSNVVGVYADAFLAGSPGAGEEAIPLLVASNGSEKLRIDSSGRLLINKETNRDKYFNGTYTGQLQVEGTNDSTRLIQFVHNANAASQPIVVLGKSRGTSVGSYTVVQNGDYLGTLSFQGADGDEMVDGARIDAIVNGNIANDNVPTDLTFSTRSGGSSSPTERLRITSNGMLGISTTAAQITSAERLSVFQAVSVFRLDSATTGAVYIRNGNFTNANNPFIILQDTFGNRGGIGIANNDSAMFIHGQNGIRFRYGGTSPGSTEAMRITSTGKVGINNTNPAYALSIKGTGAVRNEIICTDNNGAGAGVYFKTLHNSSIVSNATVRTDNIGTFQIFTGTSSDAERIRINEYGNTIFQGPTSTSSGNTGNAGVLIRGKTVSGSSTTVDLNISQATSNNGIGLEIYESSNNANALATLVFNHGSLKSMIACSRVATTNWGTDLRFYTHDTSTNSSNQHKVYERMRIDTDGRIFFRGLLGNAASGSNVKYNNSDDELRYDTSSRLLKTNITECPYGIETIKKLKPSRYTPQEYDTDGNINVTDEILIGFIADEMVEEVPEVVQMYPKSTLTKNDEDTEIVPAAISYDKLTAVLTKALQEAITKIETLEQRLTDAGL